MFGINLVKANLVFVAFDRITLMCSETIESFMEFNVQIFYMLLHFQGFILKYKFWPLVSSPCKVRCFE